MKVRMACAQVRADGRKVENLERVDAIMKLARRDDAKLIAFPENFTLFVSDTQAFRAGIEGEDGPTVSVLRSLAREHRLWLLAGGIPLWPGHARGPRKGKGGHRACNASLLINPAGQITARYDKIHLFDASIQSDRAYRESDDIIGGRRAVLAKTPWGTLGLSVCFDLRFPELYHGYSAKGATMLSVPAAFTKVTGKAHWDVLTRARAIENQCFVLAPAQWGSPHSGRETYGHSRIIDPWGRVLADCGPRGDGLAVADLDFAELKRIRTQIPVLNPKGT